MKKKSIIPTGWKIARATPRMRDRERQENALIFAEAKAKKHNRRIMKWDGKGTITGQDLLDACRLQEERCWWCQCELNPYNWHTDHRVPLCRGGNNEITNIIITCPSCNRKKSRKIPREWNGKLL